MPAPKHTAKPWKAMRRPTDGRIVIRPENEAHPVATVHRHPGTPPGWGSVGEKYPAMANAWLMAAGPELLEACHKARRFLSVELDALAPLLRAQPALHRKLDETMIALNAAISKAEAQS